MKPKTYGKAPVPSTLSNPQDTAYTVLPTTETWVTSADIKMMFKISDRTLQRWRKNETIPCTNVSGTFLYPINLFKKLLFNKVLSEMDPESLAAYKFLTTRDP